MRARQGTWKEFGLWSYNLNKDLYALPESDKMIIQTMKNENLSTIGLIRKLYNYVQDKHAI